MCDARNLVAYKTESLVLMEFIFQPVMGKSPTQLWEREEVGRGPSAWAEVELQPRWGCSKLEVSGGPCGDRGHPGWNFCCDIGRRRKD